MAGMYLRRSGFTYGACDPLTINKERTQIFIQTGDTCYIYHNDLNKALCGLW